MAADEDPRRLLADSRRLARRVRHAQRATWFPLLVFAAVTFGAIPVYRYGHHATTCRSAPGPGTGSHVCAIYSTTAFVYWPIALVLAYVAIAALYLRRARDRGIGTRVLPYAVVGIVIALLLSGAAVWVAHHPPVGSFDVLGVQGPQGYNLFNRLVGPATAIGLALLVLAFVERSRPLLLVTLGYLAVAIAPLSLGPVTRGTQAWHFLPHLLVDGSVLLLAGIAFAVAQRPGRQPAG